MMNERRGKLIVVSGPSGAGKSTVIKKVMERRSDLCFSVSATTRKPRDGEVDGVHSFFVTGTEFDRMIGDDELLEHAEYNRDNYGTPRAYVEEKRRAGMHVLLDIEVQGARQVRERVPEAIKIFVIPRSLQVREQRLRGRSTEDEEQIQRRLARARGEYHEADFYDYVVINDDLEVAASELNAIITAELCRYAERKHYLVPDESPFLKF